MGYARTPCPGFAVGRPSAASQKSWQSNKPGSTPTRRRAARLPSMTRLQVLVSSGARLATSSTAASFITCSHSYWRPIITASAPRLVCDC